MSGSPIFPRQLTRGEYRGRYRNPDRTPGRDTSFASARRRRTGAYVTRDQHFRKTIFFVNCFQYRYILHPAMTPERPAVIIAGGRSDVLTGCAMRESPATTEDNS
jgi:hypothetical protein